MTCEVCNERFADRDVNIIKPSGQLIVLHCCPDCALRMIDYERD